MKGELVQAVEADENDLNALRQSLDTTSSFRLRDSESDVSFAQCKAHEPFEIQKHRLVLITGAACVH